MGVKERDRLLLLLLLLREKGSCSRYTRLYFLFEEAGWKDQGGFDLILSWYQYPHYYYCLFFGAWCEIGHHSTLESSHCYASFASIFIGRDQAAACLLVGHHFLRLTLLLGQSEL